MIEFNHPEKGWIDSHDPFSWEDAQWINDLTGKTWYRLKENA